ncbi:MAG: hypothetical protein PHH48_06445 [Eubacteriales bacterium]|nr:hypothetical protein [Eubacteriales bacterium]
MNMNTFLLKHAVSFEFDRFTYSFQKYGYNFIYIKARDGKNGRRWVVSTIFDEVWDKVIEDFIPEPAPSERDEKFLTNTRFGSINEALEVVKKLSDPEADVWTEIND